MSFPSLTRDLTHFLIQVQRPEFIMLASALIRANALWLLSVDLHLSKHPANPQVTDD